jgi:acetylornithine/N-succinyldiaminopimelate aminotransferase
MSTLPMVGRGARLVTQHPHLMANYARAEINIVRGEGVYLFDESGNRYIDLVAGLAVCALGHAHPRITRAIADQAATLVHCSNLYHHEPAGTLADRLAELSGFDTVFFCNSGAEANEGAIKLARKHAWRKGEKERTTILAANGSFHGRTFGALAATFRQRSTTARPRSSSSRCKARAAYFPRAPNFSQRRATSARSAAPC